VKKLEDLWTETQIELDCIDWEGNSIHLKDVPALRNVKTGKIRVYPADVAKAEIEQIARRYDLEPKDVALLLLLYAKPGVFREGQVHYKYHLNKMLFYQWKNMEKACLGDTFIRYEFEPAPRGPVPKNLDENLERLERKGIIIRKYKKWGTGPLDKSLITELTPTGIDIAKKLWNEVPEPFRAITLKTKEDIFPLDPKTIRKKVHREYPEYKSTYKELDRD
jgi:hypothetical protein